ncbi:diguanylate cyclase [Hansschlegelia beijingensis]|uniref:diguanylate cyclase n=1 Tax=Hansschlegelia beijingensis TaxID=1133344 RepID=UPI00387F0A1D
MSLSRARMVQGVLLALGYFLVAYVTLVYGRAHGVAAVVWPANAMALGALIFLKRAGCMPEFAALAASNALAHWVIGDGVGPSIAIGLANGMTIGATGWLLVRTGVTQEQPTRTRSVLALFFISVVGPFPGAVLGSIPLSFAFGQTVGIAPLAFSWWLIEAVNFLILLPPCLFWRSAEQRRVAAEFRRRFSNEPSARLRTLELAAASLTLAMAGALVPLTGELWLIELSGTALLWFALRFGMFYTAVTALIFSVCAVTSALLGYWPGAHDANAPQVLLPLQAMLGLTMLPALVVAAIVSQRERARRALHADARRLSYALEGANDGLWDWDLPSGQGFFSQRAARMFGYGPEEFRTASRWDLLIHEDDRGPAKAAFEAHARGETPFYEAEVRCRHKDGSWIWIHDRGKIVERAADGTAIRAVGTYTDISERKRLESALEHLANHDALTQLANRAVFERELDRAAARMERHGGRVAVLLIDVDHFKSVNDTFGHAAGDALLVTVARRLRSTVRTSDLAARLGGDEFAVVACGQSAGEFDILAERLCGALSEPLEGPGYVIKPSVSIGVAVVNSASAVGEEIVARADRALYAAKKDGRATWRFFAGAGKVA